MLDRQEILACILALAGVVVLFLLRRKPVPGRKLPSPPGRLPIIGHRRLLGPERPWRKMAEWAKTYGALMQDQTDELDDATGPIYQIQIGNQNVVVRPKASLSRGAG
jgi:hypothetical protein